MPIQDRFLDVPQEAQRMALADLLERHRDEIVRRWLQRLNQYLGKGEIPSVDLQNGVHDYLVGMAKALRSTFPMQSAGTQVWEKVAQEHGLARARLGFDISHLVHEFILLREVIFDLLREKAPRVDDFQTSFIADLIEAAVEKAVKSYVDSRDYQLRQLQAEHVGFIVHELKNPLTSALMSIEYLLKVGQPPPSFISILNQVERNLIRIKEMVNDVLLSEGLESKQVQTQFAEMKLGELLEIVIPSAADSARKKGLTFKTQFDPSIQLRIDSNLTASAVQNILDNAVKYTDSGTVEMWVEEQAEKISIHVRDTCHGISPAELKTIFEPFRRGYTGKPGTGLGLSIARRAVEVQGGSIQAESKGESGCHFWITLPKTGPDKQNQTS